MGASVFISYRRADEPAFAGRLFDRIRKEIPGVKLFMDVDSIAPGHNFEQVLHEAVASCDLFVVVIGSDWMGTGDVGSNRLHDPEDFVRIEVESALRQNKRVVPVLAFGAELPNEADLPSSLAPLAKAQALHVRHARFHPDTEPLLEAIRALAHPGSPHSTDPRRPRWPWVVAALLGTTGLGVGVVAWLMRGEGSLERLIPTGPPPDDLVALVEIEGGRFVMGSDQGNDDERPAHEVEVSSFGLGRTEVTQQQWAEVMGVPVDAYGAPLPDPRFRCRYGCGDEYPANNLSWYEAIEFLNRLSERAGLEPCYTMAGEQVTWPKRQRCEGYRLPTEAEWEYAVRADTTSNYSWPESRSAKDYEWYVTNSDDAPHSVAAKQPNPWGLFDVHGNVREWTWDPYVPEAYSAREASERDPVASRAGSSHRVCRGGYFGGDLLEMRSADRYGIPPKSRRAGVGFRIAQSR